MTETKATVKIPTDQDASIILHDITGKNAKSVKRFPTGLANYVYDVETEDGDSLVVRLARQDLKHFFEGAIYWYGQLQEKGVPMPKLHYSEIDAAKHGFPTMIMDRLPGEDLGIVYPALTSPQKKVLADKMVEVQKAVATLPEGKGYGYARTYEDPSLLPTWNDVLDANLEKSRKNIKEAGIIDEAVVDRVKTVVHQNDEYFSAVSPTCFLDDTTTKNVVINNGELSGIVDIDSVAFGDPLLTVGLTRMSLLSSGYDTEYTDNWVENLHLNAGQKKALDIYTAIFCVNFMSEMGQAFNKDEAPPVNPQDVEKLTDILDNLVNQA